MPACQMLCGRCTQDAAFVLHTTTGRNIFTCDRHEKNLRDCENLYGGHVTVIGPVPPPRAKHDVIISELMDALSLIARSPCNDAYVQGVAEKAMKNCNAQRERNADGYMAVKK